MPWKKMLACVSGEVNEELQNIIDYLVEENDTLTSELRKHGKRILLTDEQRKSLAEKAMAMGRKHMNQYVSIFQPETLLKWFRRLVARKFDGSRKRKRHGRPPTPIEVQDLIISIAKDNPAWGYNKIMGALANLNHVVSDTTVARILENHGISPAPDRIKKTTWKQFIKSHKHVLLATDFFTTEIWNKFGIATYYVLFVIHIETRKIVISGVTEHPNAQWVEQCARNLTGFDGNVQNMRYLIHDRDSKYTDSFDNIFLSVGIKPIILPAKSPNLNAYAERFVRSIKEECLDRMILFGEKSLRYVLKEYSEHYHHERNHQGKNNKILFPDKRLNNMGNIVKNERLGGLLNYYHREAA